jgi:hypothetical protein
VQRRQARGDLGHPGAGRLVQRGAGADQVGVAALEQPELVGGEPQIAAPRVQVGDAPEDPRVERDRHGMARQPGRIVTFDRLVLVRRPAERQV